MNKKFIKNHSQVKILRFISTKLVRGHMPKKFGATGSLFNNVLHYIKLSYHVLFDVIS